MSPVPKWRFNPDGSPNFSLMVDDVLHFFLAVVTAFMLTILFLLSKNRYKAALTTHASRILSGRHRLQRRQKAFLGSMQAEEQVMRILQEEGWRHVFIRRRVPISRLGHNREIDAIGVGSVLLVVEVKHWRGYVWSNGRSWYQAPNYAHFIKKQKKNESLKRKPGGGGRNDRVAAPETREFENVEADNVVKAAALRRYIENTRRIALPDHLHLSASFSKQSELEDSRENVDAEADTSSPEKRSSPVTITRYSDESLHTNCGLCVVPVVVFTNPEVKLDPASLKKEKYVFTLDTFRVFAREALRGNVSAVAPNAVVQNNNAIVSFLAYQARRIGERVPIVRSFLSTQNDGYLLNRKLQDEVAHAVDVLRTWDLVFLHDGRMVTGDVARIEAPSANCMYERKHLLDIKIHWNDSPVIGTLKTLMFNEAGYVELILTTAKRLAVKKHENKPRDANGNLRFTLQSRKHENPNLNDRILVKVAGSASVSQTFALLDIKEVQLSHHLYESEREL